MIKISDVYREIFSRINTLSQEPKKYHIYDEVPNEPSNPHIRIDYAYDIDKSGKNYDGMVYYQYIHVFSTYRGRKEILEMTDDVIAILSEKIETDDFVAYPQLERNEIIAESDNVGGIVRGYNVNEFYRHSIIVYKFIIYDK